MWKVAEGSMSSTIATVDTFSKAIDGARARMVGHGPDVSAARRRRGVSRGRARRVRRAWAARPAQPRHARGLPDRRAVPDVPRARAHPDGRRDGALQRLARADRRLVLR